MDEGLFLQGLYNNLERSHDCDVPNILDSWRQSIRENTLLQKSIESTTSVFSDSAIKELDREAESKVTVICIDAEMIADL
jgi:transposase-like protein